MSELGQDARSIVAQARAEGGPSAEDRARIRAKLDPAWAAFRARQASDQPSRAAAALTRRPTAWGALALWMSLSLWPAEQPRFEALGELAALPPAAAAGAASRAARAPQLMASGTAAYDGTSQNHAAAAGAQAGLASASHDGSARRASLATMLAHEAEGSVTARADSHRRAALANAASRSAAGAGAQAPSPARGAVVPTARPVSAPRAANGGRSAATASATASNATRSATTASATATNGSRSAPLPSTASPEAPTASARKAPLTPDSTARGGDRAEAGDATPSQRNPGFVPQPLDDELEWIGAAQDALRKGQPSSVLRLVQEHAFRYPQGALAPERLALHALALCALQRRAAARTVLADLARRTPSSPLLDRVQRSCGL